MLLTNAFCTSGQVTAIALHQGRALQLDRTQSAVLGGEIFLEFGIVITNKVTDIGHKYNSMHSKGSFFAQLCVPQWFLLLSTPG